MAYYFLRLPFDFSAGLREAKDAGIVSLSILSARPKSVDVLTYASVLGFPVVFSLGIWALWAAGERAEGLKKMFYVPYKPNPDKGPSWRICLAVVISCCLITAFNINFFYAPPFGPAGWSFLGEEGVNLLGVQEILEGKIAGKDFHWFYGPLLLYPLALLMKTIGMSVIVERIYTHMLNLTAYMIVIFFLYRTLRHKITFVVFSGCYLATFAPLLGASPNTTYLRVIAGICSILFGYLYLETGKKHLIALSGGVTGLSFFFSQEVGVCAFLALAALLTIEHAKNGQWRGIAKDFSLFSCGCVLSVAPLLAYLYAADSLSSFLRSISEYPRFFSLGYAGLLFPDFHYFISAPFSGDGIFFYWIIFMYILAAVCLIPLVLLGINGKRSILKLTILIFGVLLYRTALGRSDAYHALQASHPAFFLFFFLLTMRLE